MAKKKTKGSGVGLWILGVLACIVVAAGIYYYMAVLGKGLEPLRRPTRPPSVTVTEQRKMVLYLPRETKDGFVLAPVTKTVEEKGGVLDAAVRALLATNRGSGLAANLIPQGTRLLEPVKVEKGVATVNLSKEFVDNFAGGSDLEGLTLNSIVATVIDSSGRKASRVKIEVEGKTVESLGGHLDLTQPLTPDPEIVKSEKGN